MLLLLEQFTMQLEDIMHVDTLLDAITSITIADHTHTIDIIIVITDFNKKVL